MTNLIEAALSKSPEFKDKMAYWVHQRKKVPSVAWVESWILKVLTIEEIKEILNSSKENLTANKG